MSFVKPPGYAYYRDGDYDARAISESLMGMVRESEYQELVDVLGAIAPWLSACCRHRDYVFTRLPVYSVMGSCWSSITAAMAIIRIAPGRPA